MLHRGDSIRKNELAAIAVVGALTFSAHGARGDGDLPAVVAAPDDSALSEGKIIHTFGLPDSVFTDLGYTLTESSGYGSPRRFGFAVAEFQRSLLQEPAGRTGGIGAPSRWPQPPAGDMLRGVRNWDAPFGTKFLRGTLIITGTEIASGVVLAFLPQDVTKWGDDAYQKALSNLKRAWTEPPVWDKDVFFHNWIGHPYAGAFYYNMMRSQGGTVWQSFGFALFQSTLWEYVFEAVAEQPSIQDLFVTPIAGSLLGELFHHWSLEIVRKGRLNFGQKVLVFFLNPAYVINNGFRAPE